MRTVLVVAAVGLAGCSSCREAPKRAAPPPKPGPADAATGSAVTLEMVEEAMGERAAAGKRTRSKRSTGTRQDLPAGHPPVGTARHAGDAGHVAVLDIGAGHRVELAVPDATDDYANLTRPETGIRLRVYKADAVTQHVAGTDLIARLPAMKTGASRFLCDRLQATLARTKAGGQALLRAGVWCAVGVHSTSATETAFVFSMKTTGTGGAPKLALLWAGEGSSMDETIGGCSIHRRVEIADLTAKAVRQTRIVTARWMGATKGGDAAEKAARTACRKVKVGRSSVRSPLLPTL